MRRSPCRRLSTRRRPVYGPPRPEDADTRRKWDLDAQWWNDTWREGLNVQRAAIGLEPVTDVRSHVTTDRPLLAADPTLAPWPSPSELDVVQTGAWLMPDQRALSDELENFLDAGEPPILFGFGSILMPRTSGPTMIAGARALGYRAIVLRGMGQPGAIQRFRGLAVPWGDQPAGTTSPGSRDRAPRRLRYHDPGDAGRHTAGRDSARLRPALLCGTRRRSWHRDCAPDIRTDPRVAGRGSPQDPWGTGEGARPRRWPPRYARTVLRSQPG